MLPFKQLGTITENTVTDWVQLFRDNDAATSGTIIAKLTSVSSGDFDGTIAIEFSNDWDGAKSEFSYNTTTIDSANKNLCYEVASPFRYVRFNFTLNAITSIAYEIYGNFNTELP